MTTILQAHAGQRVRVTLACMIPLLFGNETVLDVQECVLADDGKWIGVRVGEPKVYQWLPMEHVESVATMEEWDRD